MISSPGPDRNLTMRTLNLLLPLSLMLTLAGPALPASAAEPPPGQPAESRSGEVDLRPRFRKGDQTRFIMTIDSSGQTADVQATPPGRGKRPGTPAKSATPAADQTMKQELGLLLRVKEADPEKGATVELVYESLKVEMRTPDLEVSFDSTRKPAPPAAPSQSPGAAMPTEQDIVDAMLRPMVGATITMQIDPDGNITSTSGGSALSMAGMLSAMAGLTGGPMPAATGGDALGSLFSVAKGRGSAAVGESWTTEDTLDNSLIGSFRISNKTTLKSHARGLAELAFEGRLDPGSQAAPGLLSGSAQIKESDFTGRATWDTQRGMLKSMTSEQRTVMDAAIPDTETGQRDVSMTSRTRVTVKRVD